MNGAPLRREDGLPFRMYRYKYPSQYIPRGKSETAPEAAAHNGICAVTKVGDDHSCAWAPDTLPPMKAIVITRLGGPEVLEVRDLPEPVPEPGQTLVRVETGGLNFADLMTAQGGYPGTPKPPLVAGREFAGVDEASGRRVMGYTQWAAFAEKTVVRPELLWTIPEGWSAEQAAAFPVNYFTAYFAYWEAGFLPAGSSAAGPGRVMIHAVAGGVGTAAVQIGKILGAEMYGTSSSEDKLVRVKQLGLQHAINYKERDYEEAIEDMTKGEGVNAVFEMLGGEHTAKSIRCLSDFGKVVQYGTATGKHPQLDLRALYAKAASVQGLWLTYLSGKRDLMNQAWKQLSVWVAEGKLHPVVGHVLTAEHARQGYELLQERKNFGKVVLKIA
jgi:NADPH:quinone reductase-like Zn-dependent oxidoreductase